MVRGAKRQHKDFYPYITPYIPLQIIFNNPQDCVVRIRKVVIQHAREAPRQQAPHDTPDAPLSYEGEGEAPRCCHGQGPPAEF